MTQCCMGQDCPSVLLYMMHSNNNNNDIVEIPRSHRRWDTSSVIILVPLRAPMGWASSCTWSCLLMRSRITRREFQRLRIPLKVAHIPPLPWITARFPEKRTAPPLRTDLVVLTCNWEATCSWRIRWSSHS